MFCPQSRTKDNAAHAGLSPLLPSLRVPTSFSTRFQLSLSLNNNLLIVVVLMDSVVKVATVLGPLKLSVMPKPTELLKNPLILTPLLMVHAILISPLHSPPPVKLRLPIPSKDSLKLSIFNPFRSALMLLIGVLIVVESSIDVPAMLTVLITLLPSLVTQALENGLSETLGVLLGVRVDTLPSKKETHVVSSTWVLLPLLD